MFNINKKFLIIFIFFFLILGFANISHAATARPCEETEIGCGSGGGGGGPVIPGPSVNFSASPTSLGYGDSTTLTWSSPSASSCMANGDWSGAKSTSGSEQIEIRNSMSKTYSITCSANGGYTTKSVTVKVVAGTAGQNCSCYALWQPGSCWAIDIGNEKCMVGISMVDCSEEAPNTVKPYCPTTLPAPTMSVSASDITVASGGSGSSVVTINSSNISGNVKLEHDDGLVLGTTITLPSSATSNTSTTKTLSATGLTHGGTITITASGTGKDGSPISASETVTVTVNPVSPAPSCGTSNGGTFSTKPTTGLCSVGAASTISGSGPWSWSCSNGGNSVSCSANKENEPPMTGSISATDCKIPANASSCNSTITWSTINPVGTSAVTSSYPSTNTIIANGNSGSKSVPIPYYSRNFFLYNSEILLDSTSPSATCISGTSWNVNSGKCVAEGEEDKAPTVSIFANPGGFTAKGGDTTITWSSQSVTACSGTNFKTGGAVNNSSGVVVNVKSTTTFSITCTKGAESVSDSVTVPVEGNEEELKDMTGSISATDCKIPANASSCNSTITWSTINPVGTSAVTSSYPSTNTIIANGNSGSKSVPIPYYSRNFFLYNSEILLDSTSPSATCISGTSWNVNSGKCVADEITQGPSCGSSDGGTFTTKPTTGLCSVGTASTVSGSGPWNWSCSILGSSVSCSADKKITYPVGACLPSHYGCAPGDPINQVKDGNYYTWGCYTENGTALCSEDARSNKSLSGDISATDCTIESGSSTCISNVSWSVVNPIGSAPTEVTKNNPEGTFVSFSKSGNNKDVVVNFGDTSFFLYHKEIELASASITASCASGTIWKNGVCESITYSPTATLKANPVTITKGGSSVLTWSSSNTNSCSGFGFDTNDKTLGSVTVSPTETKTYSIVCRNATTQVSDTVTVNVGKGKKDFIFEEN